MAGKRDVEEEMKKANPLLAQSTPTGSVSEPAVSLSPSDTDSDGTPTAAEETTTPIGLQIPTVMLTDKDISELEIVLKGQYQQYSHNPLGSNVKGNSPSLPLPPSSIQYETEISVTHRHSLLVTELLGDMSYPKIWMNKHIIYTLTQGLWGAYFKTEKGDDWQMYLIDKRDSTAPSLIPPIVLRTPSGQKVSTTVTLSQRSSSLYSMMLKRKCPKVLHVDEMNQRVVTLVG